MEKNNEREGVSRSERSVTAGILLELEKVEEFKDGMSVGKSISGEKVSRVAW